MIFVQTREDYLKMNKTIDVTDLVIAANSLSGALKGLSTFAYHQFSSVDVTSEDINALEGMIRAIQALADNHAQDLVEFEDNNYKKNNYINGQSIFETKE